jgi:transposase InsO family protein
MSQRLEFVTLAGHDGVNFRALCRRHRICATTGYKWTGRYAAEGVAGLHDKSRRPQHSPGRTPAAIEEQVVAGRREHPAWGGRKLHHWLRRRGVAAPSPSTITAILRRHGLLDPDAGAGRERVMRFEHPVPNDLWQMDFKGHFATGAGRCHPLTVLDDHSRFAIALAACADERHPTVQAALSEAFRRYGLPRRLLADWGSPWGADPDHPWTILGAWLIQLGVELWHGRPYHPQTQGKDERFHRTLQAEVVGRRWFADLGACQQAFDAWRDVYNLERPHEGIAMAVPADRYRASPRSFPERLPAIDYPPGDIVRRVDACGRIAYRGRPFMIGKAFRGHPVALRPTTTDGRFAVFFCHQHVASIDLRGDNEAQPVHHVPERASTMSPV